MLPAMALDHRTGQRQAHAEPLELARAVQALEGLEEAVREARVEPAPLSWICSSHQPARAGCQPTRITRRVARPA
jgi:hypothetical protein